MIKSYLLYFSITLNTVAITIGGYILWKNNIAASSTQVVTEASTEISIPTIIVNLSGSTSSKALKVNMVIEMKNPAAANEITQRKTQIRDLIITTLSNKDYSEVANVDGRTALRTQLKENINKYLSSKKFSSRDLVDNIYFTDLIYN